MAIRLAIVGPGRVGRALGRRWAEAGIDLLGFVGRDAARTAEAIAFAGAGRALDLPTAAAAHVVVLAVGDPDLPDAAARAAAVGPRSCALWVHTSGRHGLDVLAPLAAVGARIGALHPVAPFGTAEAGLRAMPGRPCVLLGEPRARHLLQLLGERLGMRVVWARAGGDRTLYHAACALAANGLTALRSAVDDVLQHAAVLAPADAALLAQALMQAALQACGEHGAAAALSGPVVRGDAATVAAHRTALLALGDPDTDPGAAVTQGEEAADRPIDRPIDRGAGARLDEVYRALMLQAMRLSQQRGLPPAATEALRRALGAAMD